MSDVSSGVHYFACFMVATGLYVAVGIPLAWLPSSESTTLRTRWPALLTLMYRQSSIRKAYDCKWHSTNDWQRQRYHGSLRKFSSYLSEPRAETPSQLYKTIEAPRFIRGHAVTLSMVAMAGLIFAFMGLYFSRRNKCRLAGDEDTKIAGKSEEDIAEMGDENPRYVFTY
jgi:hypothetical protein